MRSSTRRSTPSAAGLFGDRRRLRLERKPFDAVSESPQPRSFDGTSALARLGKAQVRHGARSGQPSERQGNSSPSLRVSPSYRPTRSRTFVPGRPVKKGPSSNLRKEVKGVGPMTADACGGTQGSGVVGLDQCPECSGERLVPVRAGIETNLFCPECVLCWQVGPGYVAVVDPWSCPGCELGTTACFERWQSNGYWERPPIRRVSNPETKTTKTAENRSANSD